MITIAENIDPNGHHDVRTQSNGLISYTLTNLGNHQQMRLYGTKEQWAELVDAINSRIYQLKAMEPEEETS